MAHTKLDKQIIAEITKYRAICLIHRYLYYVKAAPLISDLQYDTYERKLKELVTQNPHLAFEADNFSYCPTEHVGSDNPEDYPRRIEQLAEDILAHKGDHGKSEVCDVPAVPSPSVLQG
jgi:hypothetical protein